jgi:hypothetical protein
MKMISFKVSKEDAKLITRIAQRAANAAKDVAIDYPFMDAHMDITACHANGNMLDLQRLIDADDFNFNHDVFGIRRHLNRETGKMMNCFVPRFTVREKSRNAA